MRTASRELRGVHVIEEYGVDRFFERFAELIEGIDFEFDCDRISGVGSCGRNCCVDRAGNDEMVIFNEHGIEEAEAMISSATAFHCVFFEQRVIPEVFCAYRRCARTFRQWHRRICE